MDACAGGLAGDCCGVAAGGASDGGSDSMLSCSSDAPLKTPVAHALVRAVFALFGTQASGIDHSVHTSVNAARTSACATVLASGPMVAPCRSRLGNAWLMFLASLLCALTLAAQSTN